ncbi:hypothetical protein AB0M19_29230 [Streptomyces sp. NPDC051920]|uniref:hypothetical protein n=1 Tax=Streptomyces sp. NPDC051920 TaxID=3155523 RepID=UPI00341EEB58
MCEPARRSKSASARRNETPPLPQQDGTDARTTTVPAPPHDRNTAPLRHYATTPLRHYATAPDTAPDGPGNGLGPHPAARLRVRAVV